MRKRSLKILAPAEVSARFKAAHAIDGLRHGEVTALPCGCTLPPGCTCKSTVATGRTIHKKIMEATGLTATELLHLRDRYLIRGDVKGMLEELQRLAGARGSFLEVYEDEDAP